VSSHERPVARRRFCADAPRPTVQLPKTACLNPSPSFYRQFNGYTLGLLAAMFGMYGLWLFGTKLVARLTLRNLPEEEREDRIARFNSLILARTLLVLYLVYPGVSVASACRSVLAHANIPC